MRRMSSAVPNDSGNAAWWALGISLASLVQTWVIAYYSKHGFFGKVQLLVEPEARLEYGVRGPALEAVVSLRTTGKAFYVRSVAGKVKRLSDGATYDLQWVASQELPDGVMSNRPVGFSLKQNSDRGMTLVFADKDREHQMAQHTDRARELNREFTDSYRYETYGVDPAARLDKDDVEIIETQLRSDSRFLSASFQLQRLCYWESGAYELSLDVMNSKARSITKKLYTFSVSAESAENLNQNAFRIIQIALGNPEESNFLMTADIELME